jgi:DMSO/TMAO reductase YedYZ molybdopterin-dependent catalytic subunit
MKILNKNKLLQTFLFLTLFGLLLITPIGKASANTEWNLKITTLSGTTINYSYDQLLTMPKSTENAALLCFGNLVTSGLWSGVSLGYLLEQVGVDPAVASIDFKAQDGYTASLPIKVAMLPNVIIAYEKDGSPLSEELRLVLPEENGAMWIAAITSITMNNEVIDLDQFLASNTIVQNQLPSMTSIEQPTIQQQQAPIQSYPTATPKKEPETEPNTPPTNNTQLEKKTIPQQDLTTKSPDLPTTVIYGIALVAIVASGAVSYLAYSRRRLKKISR